MLRTFSDNPTCKHIVFGGCHDAGYLLNLEQYKHDDRKAARITLLESTPAYKGFVDLPNFPRARFDNVFRNQPLPDWNTPAPAFVQTSAPNNQYAITKARQNSDSPVSARSSTPVTSSPTTTASSLATPLHNPGDSWAQVGKGGALPSQPIPIAAKPNSKKKYAYYNADGERLDEALPPNDQASKLALDQRMKKYNKNLCNNWHLNHGKCQSGSACYFQHEPKLSPGELNALRYKTRSLPCKARSCENVDCCKSRAFLPRMQSPVVNVDCRPGPPVLL